MLRHLLIALVGVCSLIEPGKTQEEELDPTDDLGGWAGLYHGTGTTIYNEWTTEYDGENYVETYDVRDTLAFEAPVVVEIDTSRFCRATEVEGAGSGSSCDGCWRIVDPSCPPADLHVQFEDFSIDIRGRERVRYTPTAFEIRQESSRRWSWWATFGRSSDGAVTGTVYRNSYFDYGADYSETTTLSLVRDESDTAVEEDPTAVEEADEDSTPADFALYDGFPNPFNSSVLLRFEVAGRHPSELAIYSTGSQRVATLVSEVLPRGRHLARWDGRSDDGYAVASGVYLARLTSGPQVAMRKIVLIR
jgi:hypothetical protein